MYPPSCLWATFDLATQKQWGHPGPPLATYDFVSYVRCGTPPFRGGYVTAMPTCAHFCFSPPTRSVNEHPNGTDCVATMPN